MNIAPDAELAYFCKNPKLSKDKDVYAVFNIKCDAKDGIELYIRTWDADNKYNSAEPAYLTLYDLTNLINLLEKHKEYMESK